MWLLYLMHRAFFDYFQLSQLYQLVKSNNKIVHLRDFGCENKSIGVEGMIAQKVNRGTNPS